MKKRLGAEDQFPCHIPIHWPGEKGRSSVRAPEGLKEKIDDLLDFVTTTTNVQVTRNEFVITAIEFYLDYLLKSDNNDSIIKNISQKKREMHV